MARVALFSVACGRSLVRRPGGISLDNHLLLFFYDGWLRVLQLVLGSVPCLPARVLGVENIAWRFTPRF